MKTIIALAIVASATAAFPTIRLSSTDKTKCELVKDGQQIKSSCNVHSAPTPSRRSRSG